MNWNSLSSVEQLDEIITESFEKPIVIFKHSTRCSISDIAKSRLDRASKPENLTFYYLDLISHRDVSNAIAEKFQVYHESPQILLIHNGECVYDESHTGIQISEIIDQVQKLA